ncbi:uncharacterized protein LOC117653550 isoform X2 [Thrips palmi]|nr:uncharacterized protein LOC117653550 isoform X2 [Thrips palmi]XP_034255207.1 uncharacterized protein LOC117653550 isoform X2 [Thrips palmi]
MSDKKSNDSKSNGWNDWANKKNDWNISNSKRPKLDIHKNHLSQTSSNSKNTLQAGTSTGPGRSGSFRRTNSLPTSSSTSPQKDVPVNQEEFDAMEAIAMAEAAAAIELEMAKKDQRNLPSTSSKNPLDKVDFKKNGSSGFEILFCEEIAEEDVEECMLLASQEIQASQNAPPVADSSFSQAYNIFSKGIDTHSSILEPGFKKPQPPNKITQNNAAHSSLKTANVRPTAPPRPVTNRNTFAPPVPKFNNVAAQARNPITSFPKLSTTSNPQAEAEVRRLEKEREKDQEALKRLQELVRDKEGEASILRCQLKTVLVEKDREKSRSKRSAQTSEKQFQDQLNELIKKNESLEMKLRFEEAEKKTALERVKLLTNNSERLRVVEPRSPRTTSSQFQAAHSSKTPNRQKHTSAFMNRSTFEEHLHSQAPSTKRPRLNDDEEMLDSDCMQGIEPIPIPKEVRPEMKSVGEQTSFNDDGGTLAQIITPLTMQQILSERLSGIHLSTEASKSELWKHEDSCIDETETIPTLRRLKEESRSRKRRVALDGPHRPSFLNCAPSLQHLMSWNDPVVDCLPTRASICEIVEEFSGILHYNLLLLQDISRPSDKELRDRDQEIVSRGIEVVPLKNFDLLDERQWYKEEHGVELRRSLGIACEIASVSKFAASLVTGNIDPSEVSLKRHKFTELPEYAFLRQSATSEEGDSFYILRVICDICTVIEKQKLTIAFNGVLAGILTLLKNCAEHKVVEGRSQSYFLDVIRRVLIARPSSTVLLLLMDLLISVSNCEGIIKGLCIKCGEDDNVFESLEGLCTFSQDTCPLQMLFIQLRLVSEANRWRLVDSVSRWVHNVIAAGPAAPSWILSVPGSSEVSHIECCARFTSTLIMLLFDVFEMLQNIVEERELPSSSISSSTKDEVLIRIMRRSIVILLKLVENNMFRFMGRVEGLYEILVQGIGRLKKYLHLSPLMERYLEDLLRSEEDITSESMTSEDPFCASYLNNVTNILKLS